MNMQDMYTVHNGIQPQGRPGFIPVPPQHPMPQSRHDPSSPPVDFPLASHRGPAQMSPPQGLRQQDVPHAPRDATSPERRLPYLSRDGTIPHPHSDIIPDELSRFIEVSDLTAQNLTEEQYHELLSTYIIIRFEKIEPDNKYDSAGERVIASWAKCTRRLLPNVDNGKAREEIQRLNRADKDRRKGKGINLLKKQQSLGIHAQDQVTRAGRVLAIKECDPKRYHTILEQLDWTERPISRKDDKFRKHSSSRTKVREKKQYERASITAYFRRCPRPDQVASDLYRHLELGKRQQQEQLERQRDWNMMQKKEEREHEQRLHDQGIREEQARLSRIHEEWLLEQARTRNQEQMAQSRGPQQLHQGQQRNPGQPMLHQGAQRQPVQVPPPRQSIFPHNAGQAQGQQQCGPIGAQMRMPSQQGPSMRLPNGSQMSPQGINGQGPPQGVQGIRLPNGQVLPQGPQGPQGPQEPQGPQVYSVPNNGHQVPPQQVPGQGMRLPNHGQLPHHMSGANGNVARPGRPTTPIRVVFEHEEASKKNTHQQSRHSARSSSSSLARSEPYSDFASDSDESTLITEASFATGSPRVAKVYKYPNHSNSGSHKPRIPRYVEEPANFGIDLRERRPTRQHSVYDRGRPEGPTYVVTGSGNGAKTPATRPVPNPVPIENNLTQIREAYRAGRMDQRIEDRQRTEAEELHSTTRQYRPAPLRYNGRSAARAEIHQDRRERARDSEHDSPPEIRRVARSEIERQLERELEEDLAGLRLGRDSRFDDDLDFMYPHDQRRREARAFDEQEEIMREMEEEEQELRRQDPRSAFRPPLNRSSGFPGRL